MKINRLRQIRRITATFFIVAMTLLFLDFTGTLHGWMGWMAKIQFLPAVMAINTGIIISLIVITLLFGRVYCSVICPLGIFQDIISRINKKKNRFKYSKSILWLRYTTLAMLLIAFFAGMGSIVALLDPYSAFGRIISNIFAPIYQCGNNLLAYLAERADSYAFYEKEIWMKSLGTFAIASVTLIVLIVLAIKGGRAYCNTICPVGTLLGTLSRYSIYKIRIDESRCNGCGLCARNCKAACINSKNHSIDYSECVACFNCIDKCNKGALRYERSVKKEIAHERVDSSRRTMLTFAGSMIAASAVKAQESKMDGGLAFIEDKKIPKRNTAIVPPGAYSIRNFTRRCTGCQLCVSVCPNQVLRPSTGLSTFLQPEVSYERGYCRPECTKCSEVCPAGAILPISQADKSSTQIGHAVWIEKNCVIITDDVSCGNCARHCPTGAITMIEVNPDSLESKTIPIVNTERCIGCGACENLCPSRPFSAIYVEGHNMHKTV